MLFEKVCYFQKILSYFYFEWFLGYRTLGQRVMIYTPQFQRFFWQTINQLIVFVYHKLGNHDTRVQDFVTSLSFIICPCFEIILSFWCEHTDLKVTSKDILCSCGECRTGKVCFDLEMAILRNGVLD